MQFDQLKRREFMSLIGGALLAPPKVATARQTEKLRRVGVLFARSGRGSVPDEAFRSGLRERGYIEGKNVAIEFRTAAGRYHDLPGLATELVSTKMDVIFAPVEAALRASLQASRIVPIVIAAIGYDPFELGLVTSIARSGQNVTGVIFSQQETGGKRVQLLKEAVPRLAHVAVLMESGGNFRLDEMQRAAHSLGISLRAMTQSAPLDFDEALKSTRNERVEAIILSATPATYAQRATIARLAKRSLVPTIAPFTEFAEAGGLLAYGTSISSMFHYAASYVDRILRGTSPADLPMEQPPHLELCVNVTTAKVLGLAIPKSLLFGADHLFD
jgi:putative tryptophan/tyrosine transport system substrate-binding protein